MARKEDKRKMGKMSGFDNQYDIIRKAGHHEVLFHLFHKLGIQSNVLNSAEYSHATKTLTVNRVYRALAKVIDDHPALGVIGVSLPAPEKSHRHQLWEVRLPSINLEKVVEFRELDLKDGVFSKFAEEMHNSWFDIEDKTRPWWRLIVTSGRHATFVYHHLIGDGLSGYAFHQSLLAALNKEDVTQNDDQGALSVIPVPVRPLPPRLLDETHRKLSWLYVTKGFLFWVRNGFFACRKHFFFSNANVSKTFPTLAKLFPPSERTVTKVKTLRIERKIVQECIVLCRKSNTSFTSLLQTLIQITLALDIYPSARFGFSRVAINLRPLLSSYTPDEGIFTNAACTHANVKSLKEYRLAGQVVPPIFDEPPHVSLYPPLNKPLLWGLAKDFKASMNESIKSGHGLQNYLSAQLLGEYEEEIGKFSGVGLFPNNSFMISNILKFEPLEGMASDAWSAMDVRFSAGQIRAALSDFAMTFNVASVKEGDCFIAATYQDGVLQGDMVRRVLDGLLARLKLLL